MGTVSVDDREPIVAPPVGAGATDSGRQLEPEPGNGLVGWLERQALFVAVVALVVVVCLAGAAAHLAQDGYLALVDGRLIALHGLPQHSYLTVMTSGVRWIDQQWLAQLAFYGLQRAGGYALLVVVVALLTGLTVGLALFSARDLGGQARGMVRALPLGLILFVVAAITIRSQVFAYPLFVVVLWLLASAARSGGRRVFWVFPVLVLWANLHGSVTLGAGLAMLYGLTMVIKAWRQRETAGPNVARGLVFLIGPPLCLLATPYGTSIVHYYHSTLLNTEFGKVVTEWQPIIASPVLAAFYGALLLLTGWLLFKSKSQTPLFDRLVLIVLAIGGIDALRNIVWFGLGTIVLLPAVMAGLGKYAGTTPRRRRLDLTIACSTIALAVIILLGTFAHPSSWFQSTYDKRALTTVRSLMARDPSARIYSDVHFADWLLWSDPSLTGHIAYDASFELLPRRDLQAVANFDDGYTHRYAQVIAPYRILIAYPTNTKETHAVHTLAGTRVIRHNKKILVAARTPQ